MGGAGGTPDEREQEGEKLMGMFERIFGKREQPQGLKNAQLFKLLEGYTPAFTTFKGSVYESELIRASLDAWGRHAAKLKPNLKGSAEEELQNRMKVKANPFQEWSKFLYQTATVLGVRNTAFLVKTRDEYNRTTGIINILPQTWELVEYQGEPWIRFKLKDGKRRAERLADVGIMTRFQYKSELFGETNEALQPVLDLISIQRQGITEGIKNGASYRFSAQSDNWASDEDLSAEMERFNKFTFGNKKNSGGVLLFPNTYTNVQQLKADGYKIDADQERVIKENVFDYFCVNEDILQNKAIGDAWNAFYEGFVEWYSTQMSQVTSGMIYTDRQRIFGNEFFLSSNRLQYMSNKDKMDFVNGAGDRGLITKNEAREVFNLPPLPEPYGSQILARGEYYDIMNPPEGKTGNETPKEGETNADEE